MTTTIGEHKLTMQGTGALEEKGARGSVHMTVAGKSLDEVVANPFVYVKLPGKTGAGSWAKVNINVFGEALGAGGNPLGGNSTSPTQMLKFLKAVGKVADLGSENVKGLATTHYRAMVDFDRYASQVAPSKRASTTSYVAAVERLLGGRVLPMDVWVDAHRRLRRMAFAMHICTREGQLTEAMTMDLYDYARQPGIQIPPASEVTDVTNKTKASVAEGLKQLQC